MILIIGGAFQGKLAYALKAYNLTEMTYAIWQYPIRYQAANAIGIWRR